MDTAQKDPPSIPEPAQELPPEDLDRLGDFLRSLPPGMFPGMDPRCRLTVAEVIDRYLADVRGEIGAETLDYRTHELGLFRAACGAMVVGDCTPMDLKSFLAEHADHWPSGWKRQGVASTVKRCFNWAAAMRVIRDNPFRGFKMDLQKKCGRDMKPEEFQAALRHSDPYFRRFLIGLKLTGARPGELSGLCWNQIDWSRGIATLATHKTARKTGKPRVLVFVPAMLKLLALIRRDQHGPAAIELKRMLESAPARTVRAKEVVFRMRQLGYSHRAVYVARQVIGAVYRRVGGWAEHGYCVYELPADAEPIKKPSAASNFVFVCSKCWPWNRRSLCTTFRRLRLKVGLPVDCKLYSIRHFYATSAVKEGVNLKALATLLGHTTTAMIDRVYCHVDGDYQFLQTAAVQATALHGSPQPLPLPSDTEAWQKMILQTYPAAEPRPPKKKRPTVRPLNPAEVAAYKMYQAAIAEVPELGTDFAVYEWLIGRREFAGELPPSGTTFRRYLHRARITLEGAGKRKLKQAAAANGGGA